MTVMYVLYCWINFQFHIVFNLAVWEGVFHLFLLFFLPFSLLSHISYRFIFWPAGACSLSDCFDWSIVWPYTCTIKSAFRFKSEYGLGPWDHTTMITCIIWIVGSLTLCVGLCSLNPLKRAEYVLLCLQQPVLLMLGLHRSPSAP